MNKDTCGKNGISAADMPVISASGIKKDFGHISALRGADISLCAGRVTALIGDNGSGKSTLVKVLSGNVKPDAGMITADGRQYRSMTPKESAAAGISVVYQDLSLDDYRDVPANIFLGNELTYGGVFLNRAEMRRRSAELLSELKINIPDIGLPVGSFSGGQRQAVAVARAVCFGTRAVIFDEPTAAMGVRESAAVLKIIRSLADRGLAVLVVSHNLHQVFGVADDIAVMRLGRIVKTARTSDTTLSDVQKLLEEAESVE